MKKSQQFCTGVPDVPHDHDAAFAVELFSKLARIALASFAPRLAPWPRRPWITFTAAPCGEAWPLCNVTTVPPRPSLPHPLGLAEARI